jgi:hypothetical protein
VTVRYYLELTIENQKCKRNETNSCWSLLG